MKMNKKLSLKQPPDRMQKDQLKKSLIDQIENGPQASQRQETPPLTDTQMETIGHWENIEKRSKRGWGPGGQTYDQSPKFNENQLKAMKVWDDMDKRAQRGWNRSPRMGFADMLRIEYTLKNIEAEKKAMNEVVLTRDDIKSALNQ